MKRAASERVADVRRLVDAAAAVYRGRAELAPEIARATGLTPEGVELGFASLERHATDEELGSLVEAAGDAAHVHIVLSANVFVAPLRALAIALAAAPLVTVRPSDRDPVLAGAIVRAAGDEAIRIVAERDVGMMGCDEIHVYGRDETIAEVRRRARAGVRVRGHGAGMGVALVTGEADLEEAAAGIAADVVVFDQRGCMSPRVVLALGDGPRAEALATAIDRRLIAWAARVPRGTVAEDERVEGTRWLETLRFAGRVWSGPQHAVGLGSPGAPLLVPPAGRNLYVVSAPSLAEARASLDSVARVVVVVGCDDPVQARALAPPRARVSFLGKMQHPPLDGPVDRRG